jgi:hypothetical protein
VWTGGWLASGVALAWTGVGVWRKAGGMRVVRAGSLGQKVYSAAPLLGVLPSYLVICSVAMLPAGVGSG